MLIASLDMVNKVGSPQYLLWLTPIVVVGVIHVWNEWRAPAYLVFVISVLTTLIFPVFYLPLVAGEPGAVLLLTARNLLLVVLLGWAVRALAHLVRSTAPVVELVETTTPTPARGPRTNYVRRRGTMEW